MEVSGTYVSTWVTRNLLLCLLLMLPFVGTAAASAPSPRSHPSIQPNDIIIAQGEAERESVPTSGANNDFSAIGDSVDLYTGRLSIRQTDLVVPGTGPEIRVERTWTDSDATYASANLFAEFGDWALNIPRIEGFVPAPSGPANWPTNRCSAFDQIDFSTLDPQHGNFTWPGALINQGFTLEYGGAERPLVRAAPGIFPNGTVAATKDFIAVSCVASIANGAGQGFQATLPDGTQVLFNYLKYQPSSPVVYPTSFPDGSFSYFERARAILYATKVTDRFGNHIDYNFDANGRLSSITGSDGRSVSFTWTQQTNEFPVYGLSTPNAYYAITSLTSNTQTWNYHYEQFGVDFGFPALFHGTTLRSIARPDGTGWTYHLTDPLEQNVAISAAPTAVTVTSPAGALVTFSLNYPTQGANFPRGNVPKVQFNDYDNLGAGWSFIYTNIGLIVCDSKKVTGPGLPGAGLIWTYSRVGYPDLKGWLQGDTPGATQKTITTTSPEGVVDKYVYSMMFDVTEANLLEHDTYANSAAPTPLAKTVYTYTAGTSVGTSVNPMVNAASNTKASRPSTVTITQDGTNYITNYTSFDTYNNPLTIDRSNDFTTAITETRTYHNNATAWVLGELESSALGSVTSESYTFWPSDQVKFASAFGLQVATSAYNADGTLLSQTDGNGHATTFSSYFRGTPQTTTYADTKVFGRVVNGDGTVFSTTPPRGYTTTYGHDPLGRLNSVTYPTSDTVAWSGRTITYVNLSAAELGMPIGTWRVRTVEGAMQRSDYYDGLLRLVLREEKDTGSGTLIYTRKQYDSAGRVTFQSYPSAASAAAAGINTTYDAIGRSTKRATTDGVTLESIAFLSSNRRQVTDGNSNITTTSYQAFGTPDTTRAIEIDAPESQTTTMFRDVFGHVLSATQSGVGTSRTRTYIYDSHLRLCKSIDPERGQSVTAYDAASQIDWTAAGQSGSATACDYANVIAGAKTTYAYSVVGRQTGITYGDATGNVTIGHDDDGHLTSVTNPAAAWTWGYDKRGLLETETAVIDSQTLSLVHGYNSQGLQNSLTYPDSTGVSYAPDAWGRPTQLGTLATSIGYYPNGVPQTYFLGNGLAYAATLNARQWFETSTLASTVVLQGLAYFYDTDGDLKTIIDTVDGSDSASLSYDGLHRLDVASGCWGDYGYEYDSNNNIKSRVGTHSLAYTYDTSNRLSQVGAGDDIFADGFDSKRTCQSTTPVTRSYTYDAHGRPNTNGPKSFVWNLADEVTSVTGVANYVYDGRGKRIKTTQTSSGAVEYTFYDLNGQLVYTQKGTTKTDFVSLSGKPFAQVATTGTTYLHPDVLGSPRIATNGTGVKVWHEHYDPFGVKADNVVEKLGYTAHAYDAETGLTYAQARYYDAAVGRFLSGDPKLFEPDSTSSFNRYAYAVNNPYRAVDRTGAEAGCVSIGVDCLGGSLERQIAHAELGQSLASGLEWLDREVLAPMGPFGKLEELAAIPAIAALRPTLEDAAVAARATQSSSRLGRALEAAGEVRGPGEDAHHIVAQNAAAAAPARAVLEKFGVDIHSAPNGTFLPSTKQVALDSGSTKAVHQGLHTEDYYKAVNAEIESANSADEVVDALDNIADLLDYGRFPEN